MKKNHTLIAFLLFICPVCSTAQVNYGFSAASAIYSPVTGGTSPTLINRPYDYGSSSFTYDEGFANDVPVGFTFNYNGIDYTAINICANGFATFGGPINEDVNFVENFYVNNLTSGPLSYSSICYSLIEPNAKPVLAPLWDDLSLQTNSNLRYLTTGTPRNRIFTFEWAQALWQYSAGQATLSFELKLYEGSNIIEFCYKDEGGPSSNGSASIGITANNQMGGGFMSLENTSASPSVNTSVETADLANKPANNQIYRFTPLLCSLPLNVHYNSLDNTSINFSWDAPAGISNFEYNVSALPHDPVSGTSTAATNITVSSLSPDTKYYLHVRSYCSASSQSAWTTIPFTTTQNASHPPAISWQKSFGGTGTDAAGSIAQTSDGGYVVAGSSYSNDGDVSGHHGGQDFFDYWIVKINSVGAIQWQKSVGGDYDDVLQAIKQTSDGGYIAVGFSNSLNGDVIGNHTPDGAFSDYWVVKLNNSGNIEWTKTLGGSSDDYGYSIEQTSDGGYIVAGTGYSVDGDASGNHGLGDYWIVKLSGTGVIQWQKSIGGSNYDEAFSIKQTSDGGYIVAGDSYSNDGDVSGNHGGIDYSIVKLSGTGVIQWQKSLGGSGTDEARSIDQTSDGGYIIAGFSNSNDGDVTNNSGGYDYWIVKINSSGVIQWQKSLGGSCDDYSASVKQTLDGGYIIAASSSSKDGGIVKLGSDGTVQWKNNLGAGYYVANAIQQTPDGGYIVEGSSASNVSDISGNHGGSDYWVAKLSPEVLLPISLLDFSGKVNGKQNLLYWTTAGEQNNAGFEMQRSSDGVNFKKIDFINSLAGNGNSYTKLDYKFIDINYTSPINYYRLKQTDKDGKFNYSNIVVLKNNLIVTGISIYPNPAKNILNAKIILPARDKITGLITDVSGRILINKITQAGTGESNIQFDISSLAPGTYFLKLLFADGGENAVKKFVKE